MQFFDNLHCPDGILLLLELSWLFFGQFVCQGKILFLEEEVFVFEVLNLVEKR